MNAGFYKLDGDLLYGPNFVYGPTFELLAGNKDTYTYPVEGWYWFDTLEEACNHFGLDISNYFTSASPE
jgi:hypothetical protein